MYFFIIISSSLAISEFQQFFTQCPNLTYGIVVVVYGRDCVVVIEVILYLSIYTNSGGNVFVVQLLLYR